MRTLVDLSDEQIERLNRLAAARRTSRAALVREAIDGLLDAQSADRRADAFGLWAGAEDGLAYQRRMREEW